MVDRRKSGGALRSAAFLILIIVVAGGMFGLAVTLSRLAGDDFGDAQRQGKAEVTSCVRHGPISTMGFGYWDACTASITWDDGATGRITVAGVLKSSDIGTEVRVGDLGNYRAKKEIIAGEAALRAQRVRNHVGVPKGSRAGQSSLVAAAVPGRLPAHFRS